MFWDTLRSDLRHTLRLGPRHGDTKCRQLVITPPLVVVQRVGAFVEFFNQPAFEQPRERTVERAGMQRDGAGRPPFDLAHDAVAVLLAVGKGQQNLEGHGSEREESVYANLVHRYTPKANRRFEHIDGSGTEKVGDLTAGGY